MKMQGTEDPSLPEAFRLVSGPAWHRKWVFPRCMEGTTNPKDLSHAVALSALIVLLTLVLLSAFSSCIAPTAIHTYGLGL